jgi:predicted neuraminidase
MREERCLDAVVARDSERLSLWEAIEWDDEVSLDRFCPIAAAPPRGSSSWATPSFLIMGEDAAEEDATAVFLDTTTAWLFLLLSAEPSLSTISLSTSSDGSFFTRVAASEGTSSSLNASWWEVMGVDDRGAGATMIWGVICVAVETYSEGVPDATLL